MPDDMAHPTSSPTTARPHVEWTSFRGPASPKVSRPRHVPRAIASCRRRSDVGPDQRGRALPELSEKGAVRPVLGKSSSKSGADIELGIFWAASASGSISPTKVASASKGAPTWRAHRPVAGPYDGEGMPPGGTRRHTDSLGGSDQSELRSL